jgi:MATE family multidrug resistance protein
MIKRVLNNEKIRSLIAESWALSWPMTIIMFFEFLIGITDVYVAGKLGKEIQAAYGLAFQMYFIFILVGIAISVGTVSVVSQLFTAERDNKFVLAIRSALALSCIAGIIFGLAGFVFAGVIINIFNIPPSLKSIATSLLRIYSIGFLFDYVLININGILRSAGRIKSSVFAMVFACVLNVVLDFVLVLKTPMGYSGIAWATVISLFAGALIAFYFTYPMIGKLWGVSFGLIKQIISISWPAGIIQIVWQLGAAVLFLIIGALPEKNVEIMAAFANGLKIESVIFLSGFAFNMANAVIIGNLLGKKEYGDAFKGGIITALIGVSIVSILTVVVMLNAKYIALFLSPDLVVANECIRYVYIALISEPFMAWAVIIGGGLTGAGDTKGVMIITVVSVWLVRLPCAYIFGILLKFGAPAIWWAMNLSQFIQFILITRRFMARKWVNLQLNQSETV